MSCEVETFPHIYYTVSELKTVKDVRQLKNTFVKAIGYFSNNKFYDVIWKKSETLMDADNYIDLDLTHLNIDISSNKPYLITAVIFTVDFVPILTVKTLKKMDYDSKTLLLYHRQFLLIRKRTAYFEDLKIIAGQNDFM